MDSLSVLDCVAIVLAGLTAGAVNTAVGSGSLITFPLLLALGVPPVTSNVSNTMGLVGGGLGGVFGYRRELAGQTRTLKYLVSATTAGGIAGASLLIMAPPLVFATIVPYLIGLALVLVLAGPSLQRRFHSGQQTQTIDHMSWLHRRGLAALAAIAVCGVYGGYFGAAQGIMVFSVLSILLPVSSQQANGLKNVTVTATNIVAAVFFLFLAPEHLNWLIAVLIAVSSTLGGVLGARLARRLSPTKLRLLILMVGFGALIKFIIGGTS